MRFIKNYFYNRKLKKEAIEKTQKNIGMIHAVLIATLTADKVEAEKAEKRHKELMELSMRANERLEERLKKNNEQVAIGLEELKKSLDNFTKSQAGMISVIQKFFKIEIDAAKAEANREIIEPTEHDEIF